MTFWHDKQSDSLIYQGRPVPAVRETIPELKSINGSYFAVPRTLRNSQILRHWSYPVAPIITDAVYSWPRPPRIKHPYASQKLAANFMCLHPRCFNLSDPGAGKTEAALWAADYLMKQHAPGTFRCLVVAPLSILQRVWALRIHEMFLGARTWEVAHGDPAKRMEALSRKSDFTIINFDGVGIGTKTRKTFEIGGLSKAIRDDAGIKLVIVDEASAYKDASTKRHRIARHVIGNRPYLWLMTGSPTPNAPTDAYGLSKLVNNAFGKSFKSFQMDTMYKPYELGFRWLPKKDGYEKAAALLSPSIRIDIRDVWDAPPMVTHQRQVELTPEQKKQLAELKRNFAVKLASGKVIDVANEVAARSKYLQISLGAVYDDKHSAHKVDSAPRISEIEAVIEEVPGKWLCFVPFTSAIDSLHQLLKKKHKCVVVNGTVGKNERDRIFTDFQEGDLQGIIADPGTMAHGLDLWMARAVIWYGATESAEEYQQANKRAHRPGQKYPVSIVQIVSNKLEIEIFRRLENNLSLQGSLLDLARDGSL